MRNFLKQKGVAMKTELEFAGIPFLNHFSQIEDPRINRKKLYPLTEVFLITLCGTICGAESWRDLEMFGIQKLDFLRQFLPFDNGVPSHDTFGRIFSLIDPKKFGDCFIDWVKAIQEEIPALISIDGKTIRRSYDKTTNKAAIHLVSAFASEARLALGQVKINDKSNEITAIPVLLNLLAIKGAIVTIDAMGCQRSIAADITNKGADYVLALKGNQGQLLEQVKDYFVLEKQNNFKDVQCDYFEETDKGHGRIEIRRCWATEDINWIENKQGWQSLKSIALIESTRIVNSKTTTERRYFISSLPAKAQLIARSVRSHWAIENSLHWILDVTLNEDGSRIRARNAPENIAIIRKAGLNMLQLAKTKDVSIRGLRKAAGWSDEILKHILLQKI
jgi:predicted transposase YbfD/YdcC